MMSGNNIILQHWTGEMNELGLASQKNISKYAEWCDLQDGV